MSLLGQIVAGESATPAGQQAVINVIQNRAAVNFGGYGTSLEQQATAFQQFSAYPNALGQSSASTENLVSQAQNGTLGNIVPNSLNYANPSIMSQSSQPNSWVWSAQASGQGVQIGGNTFWANSKGGSPGYDPTQLASGASTPAGGGLDYGIDNQLTGGWDGIAPDTTGISGAGTDGVGAVGSGLGTLGWDGGSLSGNTNITGFSVAGVNAPLDTSSGGFAGGGASAGGLTGGGASSAGASAFPGSGSGSGVVTVSGQAGTAGGPDATQTGGGTSTAPQNTPTLNILGALPTAVGTGLAAIGQNINNGISTAVNQATTGLQSVITNATGLFTRGAIMVFGILLVIIALVVIGLHGGGKTVAYATDRMGTGT